MKIELTNGKMLGALAGTVLAILAQAAPAAAAVYLDRADFNAALGVHTFMDFENVVGSAAHPQNYPTGPGHYTTSGGITVGDLNFASTSAVGTYILHGTTERGIYSLDGSWNGLATGTMLMTLAGSTTAFGLDFGGHSRSPRPYTISVRPIGGVLTEVGSVVGGGAPTFFGYTGAAFDQVSLGSAVGDYVLIDNIAFGDLAAVAPGIPEPATWAMLLAGFGVLGAAARRRGGVAVSA